MQLKLYTNLRSGQTIVMTTKMPVMLERIRRCRYCGTEVTASALSFEENPYCVECLGERLSRATGDAGKYASWSISGDYAVSIDLAQQRPQ
jgi:hypothetical protein